MAKPSSTGPKLDHLPLDHMPLDRLSVILPEGSPLLAAIAPEIIYPPIFTGLSNQDVDEWAQWDSITFSPTGIFFPGVPQLYGTPHADKISGNDFKSLDVSQLFIATGAGDDLIDARHAGPFQSFSVIGGSGNDVIYGAPDTDNFLYGASGSDKITGGSGSDLINGGYGADVLTGGAGSDRFEYFSSRDTGDTITDFHHGEDSIALSSIFFGTPVTFQGEIASPDALQLHSIGWSDRPQGGITVFAETDGIPGADMAIHLMGLSSISISDFA